MPPYTLPDVLMREDGKKIGTAAQWQTTRRPEVMRMLEQRMVEPGDTQKKGGTGGSPVVNAWRKWKRFGTSLALFIDLFLVLKWTVVGIASETPAQPFSNRRVQPRRAVGAAEQRGCGGIAGHRAGGGIIAEHPPSLQR